MCDICAATNSCVDRLFTVPQPLTDTALLTGQSTFASLAKSANLSTLLDNTPSITVFIPSNQAFSAAGLSSSGPTTEQVLAGHVVTGDEVGYLPNLSNGQVFTTSSGSSITVTVQGENYFVNGALITQPNLILPNGVAHVVNQVSRSLAWWRSGLVTNPASFRSFRHQSQSLPAVLCAAAAEAWAAQLSFPSQLWCRSLLCSNISTSCFGKRFIGNS